MCYQLRRRIQFLNYFETVKLRLSASLIFFIGDLQRRVLQLVFQILTSISRRVATCKPGKPGLTSFSETLAFFFIQFISFRKMKVQGRQNGPSKSFRAYQKKLAGYAPDFCVVYIYMYILFEKTNIQGFRLMSVWYDNTKKQKQCDALFYTNCLKRTRLRSPKIEIQFKNIFNLERLGAIMFRDQRLKLVRSLGKQQNTKSLFWGVFFCCYIYFHTGHNLFIPKHDK